MITATETDGRGTLVSLRYWSRGTGSRGSGVGSSNPGSRNGRDPRRDGASRTLRTNVVVRRVKLTPIPIR